MFSDLLKSLNARALVARMRLERHSAWKSLRLVEKRPGLESAAIVGVVVVRNEKVRLDYFLSYHRRIGVEHFVVIDNESTDETVACLAEMRDVTYYRAKGSYKKSHFGVNWVNAIASRWLTNRWVLILDADEMFVYPRMDELSLAEFAAHLDSRQCEAVNCVMVDLYGHGKVADAVLEEGMNPLDTLTHFDHVGYERTYVPEYDYVRIIGGPRRRAFFKDAESAPTLSKTPFIKWKKKFLLVHSCHVLWPFRLNREGELKAGGMSGAILHLKLSHDLIVKTLEERGRKQRFAEEYHSLDVLSFFEEDISLAYDGWRCLQKCGLLSEGRETIDGANPRSKLPGQRPSADAIEQPETGFEHGRVRT